MRASLHVVVASVAVPQAGIGADASGKEAVQEGVGAALIIVLQLFYLVCGHVAA
jgi:hypothetical protein